MPYQLHSMSKHMAEKFHRSYQSEADKEVSTLVECTVYSEVYKSGETTNSSEV
jgi:hypothetical protein